MGLYFFSDWFSKTTGYVIGDEEEETSLAKCLSEKGTILYGAKKCPNCEKQRDFFGKGFRFLNYKECNGNNECSELRGLPAWMINGKFHYGLKSLEDLKLISGCQEF